jgi:hypothetical protein
MVADWLKLVLIQQFFSLLAADGTNDTRRLKFWERYHDSIDDMYFALGNSAYYHNGPDFREIRKKMEGRLLNLQNAGSPDNNAFIMCIGNHVIVEFGLKGNACYIFRRDELPFALSGYVNGDGTGLKGQPFVDRLLHHDANMETWERKFQRTIARLMSVQPGHASSSTIRPASEIASVRPARDAARVQSTIDDGREPATSRYADSAILQSPAALLADRGRNLDELCRTRGLKMQDLRGQNGNLWVLTDESDAYVSKMLGSFGLTYKSGKGWWRK